MSWLFVQHAGQAEPLIVPDEALAAAPPAVAAGGTKLLPRQPLSGPCRLCGTSKQLTREHIPLKAAGNIQTHVSHSFEDWLARSEDDELPGGVIEQGGIWGRTLCASCNSLTGQWYGEEFVGWVARAEKILRQLPHPEEMTAKESSPAVEVEFGGVRPGAFVRQVLSLMCSVAGPWALADRHPVIRSIVLDKAVASLPAGMSMSLALYQGPGARIAGPALEIDQSTGDWRWVVEVAHRPFAMLMVLATNTEPPPLLEISQLTEIPPDQKANYQATMNIGFGHTPYPGDYRTQASVLAGRGVREVPWPGVAEGRRQGS